MKILVDTREQKPLTFRSPFITEIITTKLDVGDYGCRFEDGHVVPIVFERKSLGDLYGTMGSGYPRFKECIKRAQTAGTQLFIIVEAPLTEVRQGYERSQIKGESMVYKVFTLWVRHNVQTIYTTGRAEMSQYITNFYIACGKEYLRGNRSHSADN